MAEITPCYECKDRHDGCHSSCEAYKAYRENKTNKNAAIRKNKQLDNMTDEVRFSSMHKNVRSTKKQTPWGG